MNLDYPNHVGYIQLNNREVWINESMFAINSYFYPHISGGHETILDNAGSWLIGGWIIEVLP